MPSRRLRSPATKLILGEGKDEVGFFRAFLAHHGIAGVTVEEYKFVKRLGGGRKLRITGVAAVTRTLRALPSRIGFVDLAKICVTRDVDVKPIADIMAGIGNALRDADLPSPNRPDAFVESDRGVRVGVFLLPGQGREGTLEDLCLEAIRDDPAWPCIESYFSCLHEQGLEQPKLASMISKAKIQAWLASRKTADLARVGIAAQKGYIDWDHAAFDPLKTFLRSLFEDSPPAQT